MNKNIKRVNKKRVNIKKVIIEKDNKSRNDKTRNNSNGGLSKAYQNKTNKNNINMNNINKNNNNNKDNNKDNKDKDNKDKDNKKDKNTIKKLYIIYAITILGLIIGLCYIGEEIITNEGSEGDEGSKNRVNENRNIRENKETDLDICFFMCREIDCEQLLIKMVESAEKSIYCAFFDYDLEKLNNAMQNSKAKKIIIVDKDNNGFFNESYIAYDNRSGYMHNKFCIIDKEIVMTGSFNPTINGRDKNDNNIVVLRSKRIADAYIKYHKTIIHEALTGEKNDDIARKEYFEFKNSNVTLCFSRGGNCLNLIKKELKKAEKRIMFMLFTLNDGGVGDTLIARSYEGINIFGIVENMLAGRYSQIDKMKYHEIDISKDCNKGMMHHKALCIDDNTIITGSMNPSRNAEYSNDENVIIIEKQGIVENYLKEYIRVESICTT